MVQHQAIITPVDLLLLHFPSDTQDFHLCRTFSSVLLALDSRSRVYDGTIEDEIHVPQW